MVHHVSEQDLVPVEQRATIVRHELGLAAVAEATMVRSFTRPMAIGAATTVALLAGMLSLYAAPAQAAPSNDNRANAAVVQFPGTITGTTVGATAEPDEPVAGCGFNGRETPESVWFRIDVTGVRTLNVDTIGSSFDTALAVYASDGTTQLGCDDDIGGGTYQSAMSLTVPDGTYYAQVRGFDTTGFVRLNADFGEQPPATMPWSITRPTVAGAGQILTQQGPSCTAALPHNPDRWVRVVAGQNGAVTLSTDGSSYDTILQVRGPDLGEVACDDDSGDGTRSLLTFNAVAGQRYYVMVWGYNGATGTLVLNGSGYTQGMPTAPAPPSKPGAPTGVSAVSQDRAARVTWTAPVNDGGAPLTGYLVTAHPGGRTATVSPDQTAATVDGLSARTTYTFDVQAINDAGAGGAGSSPAITVLGAPSAPAITSTSTGDGRITVNWTAPDDDGGSSVTFYDVTIDQGQGWQQAGPTARTATFTGLDRDTDYSIAVVAHNAVGSGTSEPVGVHTPGAPAAPTITSLTPRQSGADLAWEPPANDGGSPITGYEIWTDITGFIAGVDANARTFRLDALTNDLTYEVSLYAVTDIGRSVAATGSVTPQAVLDPPTDVRATAGVGTATVTWTAPLNTGQGPITKYTVTRNPGGVTQEVSASTTTARFTGLTIGASYTFVVTAHNSFMQTAESGASPVVRIPGGGRPDGQVKVSTSRTFLGNNVYNTTGARQTSSSSARRGLTRTFNIRIQNDGTRSERYRLKGTRSTTGFTVRYFVGARNITSQVVAGTYLTGSLAATRTTAITAKVTVARTARVGLVKSLLVTSSAVSQPTLKDVVGAKVKALR